MPGTKVSLILTPMSRDGHGSFENFFDLFFNFNDFAALVMPTVGAHTMGEPHFAAVAALHYVLGFKCMVGAAAVTS